MEEKLSKLNLSKRDAILIVLAILVIGWAIYFYINKPGFLSNNPPVATIDNGYVEEFPRAYILEPNVLPTKTTLTDYKENGKMWTATYGTESDDMISRYESLFKFTGWTITQKTNTFIAARKGNEQISATVENQTVYVSILRK